MYLDNLQIKLVVVRVAFPVERQRLRFLPVDTKSIEVVVSHRQPDLHTETLPDNDTRTNSDGRMLSRAVNEYRTVEFLFLVVSLIL